MLSKAKTPLIISQRRPKRRLIPQDPSRERSRSIGFGPGLTLTTMATDVVHFSSHIFMQGEI